VALKLADLLKEKNICQGQTMSNIFKQHPKNNTALSKPLLDDQLLDF